MKNYIQIFLLVICVVLNNAYSQKNNNNNLVHGQFVGFGEFNPNQQNLPVGQGATIARPGGSVIFRPMQIPPTTGVQNGINSVNTNGLISGTFPGFSSNSNQINKVTSTTRAPIATNIAYTNCLASCPTTNEYNPVCGNDNQTYHNQNRLNCASRCGRSVSFVRMGTCQPL